MVEPNPRADRSALARAAPFFRAVARYFRVDATGFETLPDGPMLLVANHSGGMAMSDVAFAAAYYLRCGTDKPLHVLAHHSYFSGTSLGRIVSRYGAVDGRPDTAEALLRAGARVLVYPGGDHEAFRPFYRANTIDFHGHSGFVRLALASGVPIVPVVTAGAHRASLILWQGRALGSRLKAWGLWPFNNFPIVLCLPWLIAIGPIAALPCFPWPVRIRIKVGRPIPAAELVDVSHGYEVVLGRMRSLMADLTG